jgi:hypothetical protein
MVNGDSDMGVEHDKGSVNSDSDGGDNGYAYEAEFEPFSIHQ